MRIALIADVFPPLCSSGAIQLRDLAIEFACQGHKITAMIATPELRSAWAIEDADAIQVLRLRSPRTRGRGYLTRTLGEILMPYSMLWGLRCSPLASVKFDAVIWYSPTIFLGPMIKSLKNRSGCPTYLILRDIFPEWARDMGLIRSKLVYSWFKSIANAQYAQADVIGIQTPGNKDYFLNWKGKQVNAQIEVLHNWLSDARNVGCSLRVERSKLTGRRIFIYAGNMGVAQNVDVLCKLAERFKHRQDLGFLFVGRGSESARLARHYGKLPNVIFCDEIVSEEIPGLYAQCQVGLVTLDPRHKSHNIPGKFLSYMQAGLPVLACVNEGNDLIALINKRGVGVATTGEDDKSLDKAAIDVLLLAQNSGVAMRCRDLATTMFSSASAVRQIISALKVRKKF
jgi:glycosyltransferase involved in cell wall biosynthesis